MNNMANNLKELPRFESEDAEREFWATHETSDYFDWSKAEVITDPNAFPNLKLTEDLILLHITAPPPSSHLPR
jgi:hypothetical protein